MYLRFPQQYIFQPQPTQCSGFLSWYRGCQTELGGPVSGRDWDKLPVPSSLLCGFYHKWGYSPYHQRPTTMVARIRTKYLSRIAENQFSHLERDSKNPKKRGFPTHLQMKGRKQQYFGGFYPFPRPPTISLPTDLKGIPKGVAPRMRRDVTCFVSPTEFHHRKGIFPQRPKTNYQPP